MSCRIVIRDMKCDVCGKVCVVENPSFITHGHVEEFSSLVLPWVKQVNLCSACTDKVLKFLKREGLKL